MIFRPDRGRRYDRLTPWRVGLFFLGAGVWIAGALSERPAVTGAAIVIVAVALLLGLLGRGASG